MATADNAAKARMGKLKKKADRLGIKYDDDITYEMLEMAIDELDESEPTTASGGISEDTLLKLGKVIGESVAKSNRTQDGADGEETYEDPDPAEIGEMRFYYTPTFFWILPAKRVAGRTVKPPYGKVKFELDRGQAVLVGNQWQTKYMSVYATANKRVQSYMETHEMFGKKFFLSEKEADVTSEQVRYAEFFAKQFAALSNTMAPDLYSLGSQLGVKMNHTMSLSTLRTVLAEKLAEHDLAKHKAQVHSIMSSVGKEALLTINDTQ
jgi:hypothetical protein